MERLMTELGHLLAGKKVLILGFGREGKSTFERIRQVAERIGLAGLGIADLNVVTDQDKLCEQCQTPIAFVTGAAYQKCIPEYDIVFKSPGIVLEPEILGHPKIRLGLYREQDLSEQTVITSQAECFLKCYRQQVIGITGTKGKSTTTTLLYHILRENGYPAVLMGNIGIPAFDRLEEMTEASILVFEFSCHQLEYNTYSPHRSIYLNLYEEHLDHYGSFDKYRLAKENIYRNQEMEDLLYCGSQVVPQEYAGCVRIAYPYQEQPVEKNEASVWLEEDTICYGQERFEVPTGEIRLLGHHNLFDIAVVYAVCRDLGIAQEGFSQALRTYRPLPHRLEYVGTYRGIRFFDDSISTISETTIQALDTLPNTGSVLIGGMDRGIEYQSLIEYLTKRWQEGKSGQESAKEPKASKIAKASKDTNVLTDSTELREACIGRNMPQVIFMEATGKRLMREIEASVPDFSTDSHLHLVKNLEEAVWLAFQVTKPGEDCVLSPAAASYGIFRNFEERGDRFCELIREAAGASE